MFEVLVLEDQDWVRSVLATMLEDAGFSVIQAATATEALAAAAAMPDDAIFVTDVNLGGAESGFDVAESLRGLREGGLPTLYVSALPWHFEGRPLRDDERALCKPFTGQNLIAAIGGLLPHAWRRAADHGLPLAPA